MNMGIESGSNPAEEATKQHEAKMQRQRTVDAKVAGIRNNPGENRSDAEIRAQAEEEADDLTRTSSARYEEKFYEHADAKSAGIKSNPGETRSEDEIQEQARYEAGKELWILQEIERIQMDPNQTISDAEARKQAEADWTDYGPYDSKESPALPEAESWTNERLMIELGTKISQLVEATHAVTAEDGTEPLEEDKRIVSEKQLDVIRAILAGRLGIESGKQLETAKSSLIKAIESIKAERKTRRSSKHY